MSAAGGQDCQKRYRSQFLPYAVISDAVDRGEARWTPTSSVGDRDSYTAAGTRHNLDGRRIALQRSARRQLMFRVGPGAVVAALLIGTGGLAGTNSVSAGTSPLTTHVVSMVDFSATASTTLDTHVARNVTPSVGQELNAALAETSDVAATVPDQAARALSDVAELADSTGTAVTASAGYVAPITGATITSGYAVRWGRMHNGMDFSAPIGHPLRAVGGGIVTHGYSANGLGINIRIMLDDGTEVTYGHMSKRLVATGERVEAGDVIGRVGNTGRSTGPHLHFEVRLPDGDRVDPSPWLARNALQ